MSRAGRLPGLLVVAAAAAVTLVAAATLSGGVTHPVTACVFGLLVAVGALWRPRRPAGRDAAGAAPLACAGALGYALLAAPGGQATVAQACVVVAAGSLLGAVVPAVRSGSAPGTAPASGAARRVLVAAAAATLAGLLPPGLRGTWLPLALGVVAVATLAADAVAGAGPGTRRGQRVVAAVVAATGVLLAVSVGTLGPAAVPLVCAPLLLAQVGLARRAEVVDTHDQAVLALAGVTEVGGLTPSGHARRVADLAVLLGGRLGVRGRDLADLETAALVHDLGQMALEPALTGGSTVDAAPLDRARVAALGAGVLRQSGALDRVAALVERQAEPYGGAGRPGLPSLPLASRVIRVANDLDDLTGGSDDPARWRQAFARLRLDTDAYDPRVLGCVAGLLSDGTLPGEPPGEPGA